MTIFAPALIVAGPTCSGKSRLALDLARQFNGTIINADSMQVYRDLRVLTARPSPEEERLVQHRLYGVLDAACSGNVAWWRKQALEMLDACRVEGKLPIFCGGTGLYLRALIHGLAEIPAPNDTIRQEARTLLETLGPAALHARLKAEDPVTASRLRVTDSQRIARAWEVWRSTGRGLAEWQKAPSLPPASCRFMAICLDPPRPALREAIARRFASMVEQGALEEVSALLRRQLLPSLPAMRAHGVPELAKVVHGQYSLDEAMTAAILATGRYTRRQATWFRHHALASKENSIILFQIYNHNEQFMENLRGKIENFITGRIDPNLTTF